MAADRVWVYWSKREKDFMVNYDCERGKSNPRYVMHQICDQDFLDELDRRGYDLKTLRFSIRKKTTDNPTPE